MPWAVFALAALALAVTTDERFYGGIRDGRQMLSAAFALSHYGQIGVSNEFVNAAKGPGGEAYSRYGMGTSLAEVLPMLAARGLQADLGPDAPAVETAFPAFPVRAAPVRRGPVPPVTPSERRGARRERAWRGRPPSPPRSS
jgi:hypothetical protein